MKQVYVKDVKERDWVESPFLVRDKIMAMAKNGKPYMTLKLMDRTGEIEGRVWDRVDEFSSRFEKDDFIFAHGKASVYMGKMQLVVQDLERLDEASIDLGDYLPTSDRDSAQMEARLRDKVASIGDSHLRRLMESFLADDDFLKRFVMAPAAKAMHHVYLGGLLEHSLAVADLVDDVSGRYPGLNRDLLVTGALLHDVGKIDELCYARSFDYTDEGKLIGHIVIGTELVEDKIRGLKGFPRKTSMLLKHLLLSHHGQYEFGSPKRPKTVEAVILNFLDDLDSKINGVRTHIEREPDNPNGWTSYHRLYDRYFFKDATPANEVLSDQADSRPSTNQPRPTPQPDVKVASAPAKKDVTRSNKEDRHRRSTNKGFTLGEQLRGKSLDLFSTENSEKE